MNPAGSPSLGTKFAAVTAVTITYFYFLIFAEFAFLELAHAAIPGDEAALRPIMAALGFSGIAGSLAAAWFYRPDRYGQLLGLGFLVCASGAMLAGPWPGLWAAVVVGLGTGWLTVTLVTGLRGTLGVQRMGWWIGLGTGAAYALCNVPLVFLSTPRTQALLAASLALVGVAVSFKLQASSSVVTSGPDNGHRGRIAWILIFLGLVGLDSATFYLIQHVPELRMKLWGASGTLYLNAATHFFAALLAGWAFDAKRSAWVVLTAFVCLAAGSLLLREQGLQLAGAGYLYVFGVSLYSTALVAYPAQAASPWLSAALFAVAGWAGSALGVGWAQSLQPVPLVGLAGIGIVIAAALSIRPLRK